MTSTKRHWVTLGIIVFLFVDKCSAPTTWRGPFDPGAIPQIDLSIAAQEATETDNETLILMIFGANWCPDCRALDRAMNTKTFKELLSKKFKVVKVDIGNWDRNIEFVHQWGNPIREGIPAIIITQPDMSVLYTTKAGELASARNMGAEELYNFFLWFSESEVVATEVPSNS